jgi:hypothetical protein
VKDERGRSMSALTIFTMAIKFLKDELLSKVKNQMAGEVKLLEKDIRWVLTVPAIWSDAAKQFMHEAAIKVSV